MSHGKAHSRSAEASRSASRQDRGELRAAGPCPCEQGLAVRGGAQGLEPAEAHPEADRRHHLRDRLRAVRPAPYRHLRRGRAHHHGAPRLPRAHRGQGADAAHLLLRRHGRLAQGAGQRPQQGDGGRASRQAADPGARPVRRRIRASAITTMRGSRPFSTLSASTTNSSRPPTATSPAASTRRLLKVLEHYDAIRDVILPTLGPERRATYSPFLPISPMTGPRAAGADRRSRLDVGHRSSTRTPTRASSRKSPSRAAIASCNGRPTGRCAGRRSASTTRWRART